MNARLGHACLLTLLLCLCVLLLGADRSPSSFAAQGVAQLDAISTNRSASTAGRALGQAAADDQSVEVLDLITKTRDVFANPDGTMTADLSSGPVREPDSSSPTGWSPIDTTLSDTGSAVTPDLVDAAQTYSDGGSGSLATLAVPGGDKFTEDWLDSLPAPTLNANTATYPNVQPGIDLRMTSLPDGFDQAWVLNQAPTGQLTLQVPIALKGLHASEAADGSLVLTDSQGNIRVNSDPATIYGAATNPNTGDPTVIDTLPTQIVTGADGQPMIQVSPPQSFFDNPDLTYPVTIDPAPDISVAWPRPFGPV